jgi:hypothetical protein
MSGFHKLTDNAETPASASIKLISYMKSVFIN